MSVLFAATYPDRTAALILYGSFARRAWAPDNPWGRTEEDSKKLIELIERDWGGPVGIETYAPSGVHDEPFRRWYANYRRLSASPGAAIAVYRMNMEIDVRHVLPTVRVPTLILHVAGDRVAHIGNGRYVAEHIPGAKLVELPGEDHMFLFGNGDEIVDQIEELLTGVRSDLGPHGQIEWPGDVAVCPDAIYLRLTGKRPEDVFAGPGPISPHA